MQTMGAVAYLTLIAALSLISPSCAFGPSAPALVASAPRRILISRLRMAVGAPGGEARSEREYDVPAGCRKLRIPMPMGIAFEEIEDGNGAVVVGFTEKSNGAKFGVKVGETLVACSATSLKAGKEGAFTNTGYGGRPFDNWSVVMFPCTDSPFDQILAALRSNNPRWGITDITLILKPPTDA